MPFWRSSWAMRCGPKRPRLEVTSISVAREIENKVRAALGVTQLEPLEKAPAKAEKPADKAAEKPAAEKTRAKASKAVEEEA